jgi:hypothetical protein
MSSHLKPGMSENRVTFADGSSAVGDKIASIAIERLSRFNAADIASQPDWEGRVVIAVDVALRSVIEQSAPDPAPAETQRAGWHTDRPSRLIELLAEPAPRGERLSKQAADAQHVAHESQGFAAIQWPASYVTAEQFGEFAHGAKRQTIDRWRQAGKVIAIPRTGRGYRYPLDQLDSKGQIPPGLPRIIARGGNGHTTWNWLCTEHPRLGGDTPLFVLKNGDQESVFELFESFLRGDFE